MMATPRSIKETTASAVYPSNRYLRHTHNPLAEKTLCVCQMYAVLHYFLRTESRKESNRAGNGVFFACAAGYMAHGKQGGTPRGFGKAQK